jgi:hypothetical protein
MASTSTAPTVIDALVSLVNAAGVKTFEQWPGPDAAPEMLCLGKVTWDDYELSGVKAGRQHRQENYSIGFELFVFGRAGTTPASPKAARDRAFSLLGEIEDVLADDAKAGLGTAVQWVQVRVTDAEPRVFEKGWAYRVAGSFAAHARLY